MTVDVTELPAANAATPAAPEISITNLDKQYRTDHGVTDALSGINLAIEKEEFISLIGRSGCGKTTLLRITAGLVPPTSGEVLISGRSLWKGTTADTRVIRNLGVVFQDANLFPWYDIIDNIALPLKLRGMGKKARRKRATELADLVGLGSFLGSYPRELSGGMRQRAAIARALSDGPELLLMDEPFGALDAMTRDKMNLEIQRIALATRATVVFVTHDIEEAAFLGDRVVHLTPRPGRIEQIVPVDAVRPRGYEVQTTPDFTRVVAGLRSALTKEEQS